MADHLSAVGPGSWAKAEDRRELAGLLAGIRGDVVLLDADTDCSGVTRSPTCAPPAQAGFWWVRVGRRRCASPVGRWFRPEHRSQARFRPSEPSGGLFAGSRLPIGCARPGLADLPDGPPGQMKSSLLLSLRG